MVQSFFEFYESFRNQRVKNQGDIIDPPVYGFESPKTINQAKTMLSQVNQQIQGLKQQLDLLYDRQRTLENSLRTSEKFLKTGDFPDQYHPGNTYYRNRRANNMKNATSVMAALSGDARLKNLYYQAIKLDYQSRMEIPQNIPPQDVQKLVNALNSTTDLPPNDDDIEYKYTLQNLGGKLYIQSPNDPSDI